MGSYSTVHRPYYTYPPSTLNLFTALSTRPPAFFANTYLTHKILPLLLMITAPLAFLPPTTSPYTGADPGIHVSTRAHDLYLYHSIIQDSFIAYRASESLIKSFHYSICYQIKSWILE